MSIIENEQTRVTNDIYLETKGFRKIVTIILERE